MFICITLYTLSGWISSFFGYWLLAAGSGQRAKKGFFMCYRSLAFEAKISLLVPIL
jgi:hypothetical protein